MDLRGNMVIKVYIFFFPQQTFAHLGFECNSNDNVRFKRTKLSTSTLLLLFNDEIYYLSSQGFELGIELGIELCLSLSPNIPLTLYIYWPISPHELSTFFWEFSVRIESNNAGIRILDISSNGCTLDQRIESVLEGKCNMNQLRGLCQ